MLRVVDDGRRWQGFKQDIGEEAVSLRADDGFRNLIVISQAHPQTDVASSYIHVGSDDARYHDAD